MADVVAARRAYKAARDQVEVTRLALGKAIIDARASGIQQEQIAKELELTREQIRRYQAEYVKKMATAAAPNGS